VLVTEIFPPCASTVDFAIEQLETSAQIPGGITYGELKLYPQWDSLRGDPRFEKIVASLAPRPAVAPKQ
jgi:hypothetical protein